ncbi:hypothetical protein Back11_01210 [Paenibacillus baekrokdamisoli]|uniref:Uncharacterized protein n=1 Tax=Paenibacillus baekrokdamisoli TaxID=1712516 RepID=A0A3G9IKF1_9BACL|nr:hypothetical protein [Paenibacillus baekrokdamisoli]MBB3069251.1 hypothetical protein [Paenibacillus baekrokdamisoli]BBH18776.1 hypothetical protein Back11_01210 [Paenibacillus baekrokdamisoli]
MLLVITQTGISIELSRSVAVRPHTLTVRVINPLRMTGSERGELPRTAVCRTFYESLLGIVVRLTEWFKE